MGLQECTEEEEATLVGQLREVTRELHRLQQKARELRREEHLEALHEAWKVRDLHKVMKSARLAA
eukprot:6811555-Pyramimonas_sp.AAC.1